MMKNHVDYSLYLVTDRVLTGERNILDVVGLAVLGGVTLVQLREKEATSKVFFSLARSLQTLLHPLKIPFIINDRLDIALAAGCDGVHIGPHDIPAAMVRHVIGPERILGVSVHSPAEAKQAEKDGADYVSVSPVFHTATKPKIATPVGVPGVKAISEAVSIPVVGIGGIDASNVGPLIASGAAGGAVVSAIMGAQDPKKAAADLMKEIKKAMG